MGARDLLDRVTAAGFSIAADGEALVIRPASKLTDELRAELRRAKPELMALLAGYDDLRGRSRPYRLSQVEADAAHAEPWNEAAIGRFVARVTQLLGRGIDATDADDLAERLHLRDVQADDRRLCIECAHFRRGRCGNHQQARLQSPELSHDLTGLLQHCPGFAEGK